MRKFCVLLIVAIAFGASQTASADDSSRAKGVIAYIQGDYATALNILRPMAEQGDMYAQEELGTLYYEGAGVPRDNVRAHMWKNVAAWLATGNSKATYIKIRDDTPSAEDSLRAKGVIAYIQGDYATALNILRPMAEQGDMYAQEWMGTLYYEGAGVPQDNVRAHMWKNVAASLATGNTKASYIEARDDIAKQMTAAQITRARDMARQCQASNFKQCN